MPHLTVIPRSRANRTAAVRSLVRCIEDCFTEHTSGSVQPISQLVCITEYYQPLRRRCTVAAFRGGSDIPAEGSLWFRVPGRCPWDQSV
jgi:hypothetical protein